MNYAFVYFRLNFIVICQSHLDNIASNNVFPVRVTAFMSFGNALISVLPALLMGLSHNIDQMQYQIPPSLRFPAFPK